MKGVWDIYCASRALQMDGSGVLGVLRGPTKQLVSSALVGACGMSGIEYALDGRAHCLVYRSPYDDEVLYGAASRREAYYRPVGLAAIQMIASPYSVGLTLVRNMSLSCLSVAHSHILLLTEAEERAIEKGVDAEDVPFPWEEVPKAVRRGVINSGLDMAVLSVRSMLDWSIKPSSGGRHRMCVDLKRTAREVVCDSTSSFWERFVKVLGTGLLSEMTLFASEWIISCVLDSARILVRDSVGRKTARVAVRCGMHGARCVSLWLAVCLGNGVGASAPRLQPVCMLACANVGSFLVNMFYSSLTARVEDAVFRKDDDGSDDDAGEDVEPYSPPAAASSSRDASQFGPESPDMTPMPTQEIDNSVMMDGEEENTAMPGSDDGPAAASVTHVVSSRGPRLPPRRRLVKK